MRRLLAIAFLATLAVSGCASKGSDGATTPAVAGAAAAAPYAVQAVPIRFAVGDSENNLTGDSHFTITSQAVTLTPGAGEDDVDLTSIVPANAPVEMTVKVYGARAAMRFTDASVIGAPADGFGDYDGTSTNFGIIVTRADAGQVILRVFNPGGFSSVPPEPNPSAHWEASSVVRAGLLVPGVPAALPLNSGDQLNVSGSGVEAVLLIAPDGAITRDATDPFQVVANGTAGEYVLLVDGAAATVAGPNVTMQAKRIVYAESEAHALTTGTPATWSFTSTAPLQVGIEIRDAPTVPTPLGDGLTVGTYLLAYDVRVTAPGNVDVLQETSQCQGLCTFSPVSSGLVYGFASEFLDEHLRAGDYAVSVQVDGNGLEAVSWTITIL